MITIKTPEAIARMRDAGKITALARAEGLAMVKEGVTTAQINKKIHDVIVSHGARPSFLGYGGFPAVTSSSLFFLSSAMHASRLNFSMMITPEEIKKALFRKNEKVQR